MMMVKSKSVLLSKTFWFGLAVVLLALVEAIIGVLEYVGISAPVVMGILGALVIILRWVTKIPVSITGEELVDVSK